MRASTRTALVAATGIATLLTALPAAQAITGGSPDGDGHPNVAMLLFYAKDAPSDPVAYRYRCTGSLVATDVILTAAHCTDGVIGKVLVTFRDVIAEEAPSGLPRAEGDVLIDAATGESTGSTVGFTSTQAPGDFAFVSGDAYVHPGYSHFTDMRNWNDVGVVRLDQDVDAVPMPLAPLGTLDAVAQPTLNSTLITFVGYGTEVRKPDAGPQKPQPMSYPLIRRVTEAPGQKLTAQILQVNGNPNDNKGDGGTCFGDSGGPGLLGGQQVTVTSYGYTDNCRYIDGHQRVDIPVVQEWLATFGVVDAPDGTPADEGPGKGNGKGKAVGKGNANGDAKGNAGGSPAQASASAPGRAVGHDNAVGRDDAHAVRANAAG